MGSAICFLPSSYIFMLWPNSTIAEKAPDPLVILFNTTRGACKRGASHSVKSHYGKSWPAIRTYRLFVRQLGLGLVPGLVPRSSVKVDFNQMLTSQRFGLGPGLVPPFSNKNESVGLAPRLVPLAWFLQPFRYEHMCFAEER